MNDDALHQLWRDWAASQALDPTEQQDLLRRLRSEAEPRPAAFDPCQWRAFWDQIAALTTIGQHFPNHALRHLGFFGS